MGTELANDLQDTVRAIETRGSATSDLPPLAPDAREAAAAGLRLLRVRARSVHELRERLLSRELPGEAVEEALARLEIWGLLDDEDFAREWTRGRRARRGKFSEQLRRELREKGVSDHHVSSALEGIDPSSERAQATSLVKDRLNRVCPQGVPVDTTQRQSLTRRLVAFLVRRGLPESVALTVVREVLDDVPVPAEGAFQ